MGGVGTGFPREVLLPRAAEKISWGTLVAHHSHDNKIQAKRMLRQSELLHRIGLFTKRERLRFEDPFDLLKQVQSENTYTATDTDTNEAFGILKLYLNSMKHRVSTELFIPNEPLFLLIDNKNLRLQVYVEYILEFRKMIIEEHMKLMKKHRLETGSRLLGQNQLLTVWLREPAVPKELHWFLIRDLHHLEREVSNGNIH